MSRRPLTATYRLQLHQDFPLEAARRVVPYLDRLGISHVYTSPVLRARAGSTHGYDVADPTTLNPELGDDGDRQALVAALRERGMGWVLDIVPNHMGTGAANPFWEDVLARGRASRWAHWFDIDWEPPQRWLRGRVLLPVLGDELEKVLERGEIVVAREDGAWRLKYFDSSFPVAPETVPLLEGSGKRSDAHVPLPTSHIPLPTLRRLLDAQHYALVFWRRGPREINYRRFFDVNELVALRMEDPRVFDETHDLVLRWVAEGALDGLRIDHVDGLLDPLGYLERLRGEVERRRGPEGNGEPGPGRGGAGSPFPVPRSPFPILVEKILSPGEHLRRGWPVDGTTGYECLNDLEAVLIDPDGFQRLDTHYRRLLRIERSRLHFGEVARRGKLFILRRALHVDVLRLGRLLAPVVRRQAGEGAPPREQLVEAVAQLIAELPVYRTYIDGRMPEPHPDDRAWIERALEGASGRGAADPATMARLARTLLAPFADLDGPGERERLRVVQRLQQTSGPATAKGVEDTALYIYIPLASRNEVGGEPERDLHDAVESLHRASAERLERWPRALVATNTHDTKRSADVRARLDVLSEIPDEWAARVARWRHINRPYHRKVGGRIEPDANTEYILYQSLVGIWPLHEPLDQAALDSLRARLEQYILKAAREGKMRTSWTEQNTAFEEAIVAFLHGLFDGGLESPFLSDLVAFVRRIRRAGLWNALSRVLLHYTIPGVPDTYQGDEMWSFSLVDPDNRRAVDYEYRMKLLDELDAGLRGNGERGTGSTGAASAPRSPFPAPPATPSSVRSLLATPESGNGLIKLHVTRALLHARREDPELWMAGRYTPLRASGARARHVVAFARHAEGRAAIAVASRLTWTLGGEAGEPPLGERAWEETVIPLPALLPGARWTCALSGAIVDATATEHGQVLRLADVLSALPIALLRPTGTADAS
jgi:(1->4)-alpha-D-glucan 1-alpha-D-glucosylmutase